MSALLNFRIFAIVAFANLIFLACGTNKGPKKSPQPNDPSPKLTEDSSGKTSDSAAMSRPGPSSDKTTNNKNTPESDTDNSPSSADSTQTPPSEQTPSKAYFNIENSFLSISGLYRIKILWEEEPRARRYLNATIYIFGADGYEQGSATIESFEPSMPSMGHGTDTSKQSFSARASEPYAIWAEGIYFNMGGPWLIQVKARIGERVEAFDIPLRIGR